MDILLQIKVCRIKSKSNVNFCHDASWLHSWKKTAKHNLAFLHYAHRLCMLSCVLGSYVCVHVCTNLSIFVSLSPFHRSRFTSDTSSSEDQARFWSRDLSVSEDSFASFATSRRLPALILKNQCITGWKN